MELNQTTLRGILAAVLSVDERHIVPKQGNWWNPQGRGENVANWCAYRIRSNRPLTAPFYRETADGVNSLCVLRMASVELQFVGPLSERLAQSVTFWPMRGDLADALSEVRGSVLYSDLTAISSDFAQDGNNTVVAWNVPDVRILWYDTVETTQRPLRNIDIGGTANG